MTTPVHGTLVVQSDLDACELGQSWFAAWVGGYGKGALQNLTGMTNFVVNTTAQSGSRSLRAAYEASGDYLIWFDDALPLEFTITHTTRVNAGSGRKVVLGLGHKVTLAGQAIQHVGRAGSSYALVNVILDPTSDDEGWFFYGGGTGRVTAYFLWGEFHQPGVDPANAEQIDLGQPPTQGYYLTIAGAYSPNDSPVDSKGIILGNIGEGANGRHSRVTTYRNDLGSRIRQPLWTDHHLVDIESIHRVRLYAMEARNSSSGQLYTEGWLINPVFWCATIESTSNVAAISSINDAKVRVDGARYLGGSGAQQTAAQSTTSQNRRNEVNIFVDESGGSQLAYDDWRPSSVQLAIEDLEGERGWRDRWRLGGTLNGAADGDVSGLTITWTSTVHDQPNTTGAKQALLDGLDAPAGGGLEALLATVDTGDMVTSGKVTTLTFPPASTLTTSALELLSARIPYTAQTSGRTQGTDNVGIYAGSGGGAPPATPGTDASVAMALASIVPGIGR